MIVVRIVLVPQGDQSRERVIGEVEIVNDGTGTEELGNYTVKLSHAGRYFGRPGSWRKGKVTGFLRQLSPYHLLLRALESALRTL